MLLAVSGSQGAGKTTVLNELTKAGFKVIERKTSRSILSDWGVTLAEVNNNPALTIKFQEEILKRKLEDEAEAVNSSDIWFTERTFTDLFVYALVALGKDNEYSEWLDEYYEKCKYAQESYDAVFYLQAGYFQPVNDGVRGINQHYSKMVDLVMSHYTNLMTSQQNMCVVNTPNIDERVFVITTEITHIKTSKQGEK